MLALTWTVFIALSIVETSRVPSSVCSGTITPDGKRRCFYRNDDIATRDEAAERCWRDGGKNLLNLDDIDEVTMLSLINLTNRSGTDFWTGIQSNVTNDWYWVTGDNAGK